MNNAALRIFGSFLILIFSFALVSWKLNDDPEYQGPPKLRVNPTETYVNVRETAKFFATCRPKQKWQVSKNNGLTWEYLLPQSPYRIIRDTLFIDTISIEYDGYLYRIECCIRDNENQEDKPGNPKSCIWSNSVRLNVYLPMPIRWINFDFERTSKSIRLNWYTEDKFSRIYIERLENNRWKTLSSVLYDPICSYSFEDVYPLNGYNYYRLKGIYEDGSFEYSKIAVVAYNKNTKDYKYYDIYGNEQKILEENRMYFRSSSDGKREKVIIIPQ